MTKNGRRRDQKRRENIVLFSNNFIKRLSFNESSELFEQSARNNFKHLCKKYIPMILSRNTVPPQHASLRTSQKAAASRTPPLGEKAPGQSKLLSPAGRGDRR